MKKLVATVSDEQVSGYNIYTLPIIKEYASQCGADFINLTNPYEGGKGWWNYRTMKFYDLLDEYDSIFYMDSDAIITKNCPNIFEVVPDDTIGVVFEDKGSRQPERRNRIQRINEFYGPVNWSTGFMNGGIYIVHKCHKNIFKKTDKLWGYPGFDSGHISYHIAKYKLKHIDLGYSWNHMTMFSEPWCGANRFDSYIIHYAGNGIFDQDCPSREEQIKRDFYRIYG